MIAFDGAAFSELAFDAGIPTGWVDLGAIGPIAASPTAVARQIAVLQPFDGQVFMGYGDYDDVVQPGCDLLAWGPSGLVNYGHYATDAFWSLRKIDDELWAPVTDPEIGTNPDVVVVDDTGAVTVHSQTHPASWHLFDAVKFGSNWYVCGSEVLPPDATGHPQDGEAVWKFDGTTWSLAWHRTTGYRCFMLIVYGGYIYAVHYDGSSVRSSDGVNWSAGPTFPTGEKSKSTPWDNKIFFRRGHAGWNVSTLHRWSGASSSVHMSGVRDHTLGEDGMLYILLDSGAIIDGTGAQIETAPLNSRSLAVTLDAIWVGTADSHLWRVYT